MTIKIFDFLFEKQSIEPMDTNRKCIVTAGAPGSGKTTIINKITGDLDFRSVDADELLSIALKKDNIPLDFKSHTPEQTNVVSQYRDLFRRMSTKSRYMAAKQGRGIIYHTTGANFNLTIKHIKPLIDEYGYQVKMLYVDASLDRSLERNKQRERSVPDHIVKARFDETCKNRERFRNFFGSENFHYIQNVGQLNEIENDIKRVEKELIQWLPAENIKTLPTC